MKNSLLYCWNGAGCSGLIFIKIPKIDGELCNSYLVFFIRYMEFASNYVYSVICHQSPFMDTFSHPQLFFGKKAGFTFVTATFSTNIVHCLKEGIHLAYKNMLIRRYNKTNTLITIFCNHSNKNQKTSVRVLIYPYWFLYEYLCTQTGKNTKW